jgi:hypothetical protein
MGYPPGIKGKINKFCQFLHSITAFKQRNSKSKCPSACSITPLKQGSSENKCPSASSITPSKQGSSENKCPSSSFLEGFFSRGIILF